MKTKLMLYVIMLVIASSLCARGGGKNTTWIVPITFTNPGYPVYVDTFGVGIGYTNCVDKTPGLPYTEFELPYYDPFFTTDAIFTDFSGYDPSPGCHGKGLWVDIHRGSYSESIVDTFQYQVQVADKMVPWYISWDTTGIRNKLSSLRIVDALTGTLMNRDMFATNSIKITKDSTAKNVTQFFLYATWKPIDSSFVMGTEKQQDRKMRPAKLALHQNYPNPFNPSTFITYDLPSREFVTLKVYNLLGQEIATLAEGLQEAGYKSVKFETGNLSSGVYVYRLVAGEYSDTKKMVLLR